MSLHIPDWTHSPFLPDEAKAAGAKYQPSTDATTTTVSSARTVSVKTRVIKNNGFNPVWQEELCVPFDCIGDMKELIFVEFKVRQEGKDDDDEPLGIYCAPLGCLQSGKCARRQWYVWRASFPSRVPSFTPSRFTTQPTHLFDSLCSNIHSRHPVKGLLNRTF